MTTSWKTPPRAGTLAAFSDLAYAIALKAFCHVFIFSGMSGMRPFAT